MLELEIKNFVAGLLKRITPNNAGCQDFFFPRTSAADAEDMVETC